MDMLEMIALEPRPQHRLALLVRHGLLDEAKMLIRQTVATQTSFFYVDWPEPARLCAPLPRAKNGKPETGVFVVSHPGTKLEFPTHEETDVRKNTVCFEFDWLQDIGWKSYEIWSLARDVAACSLIRPVSQWNFRVAEGTFRASTVLSPTDPLTKEIEAAHTIFHFREADFGRIHSYLPHNGELKQGEVPKTITWIVNYLKKLGWADDRIQRELLEWMHLHDSTWPLWMLAVAKEEIVPLDDPRRRPALRRYFQRTMKELLGLSWKNEDMAVLRELGTYGMFGPQDANSITEQLVVSLSHGKQEQVGNILVGIGISLNMRGHKMKSIREVAKLAVIKAMAEHRYGIAAALIERNALNHGSQDDDALHRTLLVDAKEKAETLGQKIELS
jgi:hypothetical protein